MSEFNYYILSCVIIVFLCNFLTINYFRMIEFKIESLEEHLQEIKIQHSSCKDLCKKDTDYCYPNKES